MIRGRGSPGGLAAGATPSVVRFDAGRQHLGLLDPIFSVHALASYPQRLRDAFQLAARPAADSVVAVNT